MNLTGPVNGTATITDAGYTIPNLLAGQYNLILVDKFGCEHTKSFIVNGQNGGLNVGLKGIDGTCGTAGFVDLTIAGGNASYTINWTGPSSGSASTSNNTYRIADLFAGTYNVTVVDYNGCSISKSVYVNTSGSNLTLGANAFLAQCGNPGHVSVQMSGGQPGYTIGSVSYTHLTLPTKA